MTILTPTAVTVAYTLFIRPHKLDCNVLDNLKASGDFLIRNFKSQVKNRLMQRQVNKITQSLFSYLWRISHRALGLSDANSKRLPLV